MIFDLHWWLNLTAHQLDVVRTIATVIGSAFVPLVGLLLGWGIRLLRATRREAEAAKRNTEHTERVDGQQRSVSVTEYARHAAHAGYEAASAGEASAEATRDLALWVRGTGKRRQPTTEVPRPEESIYE